MINTSVVIGTKKYLLPLNSKVHILYSTAAKINNYSNRDQSIKISTGLLYSKKIKFQREAKNFEGKMRSFWLKLRNNSIRHRPTGYISYRNNMPKTDGFSRKLFWF